MTFSESRPLALLNRAARCVAVTSLLPLLMISSGAAQNSDQAKEPDAATTQREKRTYVTENGTQEFQQSVERERKTTTDGEVEIQRFRSPIWAGDQAVSWEREVRTKKLPDGSIEREYILKTPDGGNYLTPVQIIREKITKSTDSTKIERETLRPDPQGEGHWQPIQREVVTENGPDTAKQIVSNTERPDTTGAWQVVDRQLTSSRSTGAGSETHSVRQVTDAFGRLADYEVQEQRTVEKGRTATNEVTLQRRDLSDTDSRQFYLVDHTKAESTTAGPGTIIRHVVTESDLLPNSPMRNFDSRQPQVIEQRTEQEHTAPDGTKQTVTVVKARSIGDPTAVRPAYTIVQQTDRNGYVREVYIPVQ